MTLTLTDLDDFMRWLRKREVLLLCGWPVSCCYSHSGRERR